MTKRIALGIALVFVALVSSQLGGTSSESVAESNSSNDGKQQLPSGTSQDPN